MQVGIEYAESQTAVTLAALELELFYTSALWYAAGLRCCSPMTVQQRWIVYSFLLLTVLWAPTAVVYLYGGEGLSDKPILNLDALTLVTMGHLGEGVGLCDKQFGTNRTLTLSCPSGTAIGTIEGYFGDVQGQCDCPADQTPNPECPQAVDGDQCIAAGLNPGYCFLEEERSLQSPSGATLKRGSCCASQYV